MKHLPKHLQPRYRYLAVEIRGNGQLDRQRLQHAVWQSARRLLGDAGSAHADLTVVRFYHHDDTCEAVVRTRRSEDQAGRAAIACIDRIESRPVGIRILGTSGTIQSCEEKYLRRAG